MGWAIQPPSTGPYWAALDKKGLMVKNNSTAIPGTGMSYRDLCDTPAGSEAREMWSALMKLADVLSIPLYKPQIGVPAKTVDELVADIRPLIDDFVDIAAAARAVAAMTPEVPERTEVWEVRRLVTDVLHRGEMKYVVEANCTTEDGAEELRSQYKKIMPGAILVVARVTTTTEVELY